MNFDLERLYAVHTYYSKRSLRYHLDNIIINSSPEPARWGRVREPWQDDLLRHKIPMFEALAFPNRCGPVAGDPKLITYNSDGTASPWSFCDILPRGHDKSSLEGRLASWLLTASERAIHGYIIAADKDQGRLVLEAMQDEANLNPWLAKQLDFNRNEVYGPAGKIEVVPADAGSAFGFRGNFYIFDEWTNWRKPKAREVWDAVVSGTEKVQPRIVGILSNAGFLGTWQEGVYTDLSNDPDYVMHSVDGGTASWMPQSRIDRLRKKLPPGEAKRVFDNRWITVGEDNDYLTIEEVRACRDTSLMYRLRRQPKVINYVASLDYGPKRDRTVGTVGHMDAAGVTVIDRMDVWEGKQYPDGRVHTDVVKSWVTDILTGFNPVEWVFDPAMMNGVIEWMQAGNLPIFEFAPRGGKANFDLAQALRGAVSSRNVRWYPGCGRVADEKAPTVEEELALLVSVRKAYGFRIDHTHGNHDDRAVGLGMLLCRTPEYPWKEEAALRARPLQAPDRRGERPDPFAG